MHVNITDSEGNVIASGVTDSSGNVVIDVGDNTGEVNVIIPGNNGNNSTTPVIIIPQSTINTTTSELILGDTTTLTAQFYNEDGLAVPSGKSIFRVAGKTLRNNQGEVIYVDVTGGKALLENANITSEWMKSDTTVQAIYCGNDEINPILTPELTVNVTKPEAVINITSSLEATAGETVTLTAKVTSGNAVVNTGRVVFKLNGKTLKDENGKALYINVANGLANTSYTIPAKTKVNTYKLTAVFVDTNYDRAEITEDYIISKA